MADKELREIALEINTPVIVKPWRVRAVTTKYGPKLMLVVKEGNEEAEIKWLPVDLANDLVELGVMEVGTWDDGNPKYSIRRGAPEIAICKRQAAGDKHPHYEVALPGEQDGPDMPAKPSAPAAPKGPAAQAAVPDRGTPPDTMDGYVGNAIENAKRIALAFGVEDFADVDPIVAGALITATHAMAATMFIQAHKR